MGQNRKRVWKIKKKADFNWTNGNLCGVKKKADFNGTKKKKKRVQCWTLILMVKH